MCLQFFVVVDKEMIQICIDILQVATGILAATLYRIRSLIQAAIQHAIRGKGNNGAQTRNEYLNEMLTRSIRSGLTE